MTIPVAERLLDGLSPAQRAAVTSDGAPLCILAGAGSGKTRVLTRRIAHRVATGTAAADRVLALTFTRKAAGELRTRLGALGVRGHLAAGTFHSVAYAQLRRRWADTGEREPALLPSKLRLIVPLLGGRRSAALQPADLASEIEWAKARMVEPDAYERAAIDAARRPPLSLAAMADLYGRYEAEKRKRGVVDFDDLLGHCVAALEHDREFAAAQRWRFRHLFVDEFQDVNPVQLRLLEAWRGDSPDLCVVGDPNQAIYAWNGADSSYLTEFRDRFGGAQVVRLLDNYRSSPQVLALADVVLGPGLRPSRPMTAHRPEGPVPTVRSYPTDVAEAEGVARALRDAHGSTVPWSQMAVLTRTNAQGLLFEKALRAAGVPCRVRGGGAFLQQPEVREALSDLARRPQGMLFASLLDDLEELPASLPDGDERRLHLEALVQLGREYAALDPTASGAGFAAWVKATVRSDEGDGGGDAVEIATFHRAKGLEWQVVFLAGLERGLVPIGQADTPEQRAEERRLLHVAITRAERELHCSWAETRTFGSRTSNRGPSPWLVDIEAACAAMASGGGVADWRTHIERERARLAALRSARPAPKSKVTVGANADPAVLTALKEWRSSTAKASGVPAYVIFHDTTLAAVAEARPGDRAALLALPGMGPVKAERYGDALLALVQQHRSTA